MATLSIVARPEIISPPIDTNVSKLVEDMREIARVHKTNMARLEYTSWRLYYSINGDYRLIGFESEDLFRESLGISRTTYYKHTAIGKALCTLKLADLEAIPLQNRELLMQVDPAIRDEYDWVADAKRLTPKQFADKIVHRNRQHGSTLEPMAYFRAKVPVTTKAFLEETVDKFRKDNEIPSFGEALELLIADVHDRPNRAMWAQHVACLIEWTLWRQRDQTHLAQDRWLKRALDTCRRVTRMEAKNAQDEEAIYPALSAQDHQDFIRWKRDMSEQSRRASGEEAEGDEPVAGAERNMQAVFDADEFDGDDDSFEGIAG